MSFFALKRQITRISNTAIQRQLSNARPATQFPNPSENFSVSLEPVITRKAWFRKMPQPQPVRNIKVLNRVVTRVVPLKNGKA